MADDFETVRLVAADGSATSEERYRRDLPAETLSWLYELMVLTREIDIELINLQRQGELALYASCRGQEAAQVGAAACCARRIGCFRNTGSSVFFSREGSRPLKWARCGVDRGTAARPSPTRTVRRSPSRWVPMPPRTRSARRWPLSASVRTR